MSRDKARTKYTIFFLPNNKIFFTDSYFQEIPALNPEAVLSFLGFSKKCDLNDCQ